MPAPVQVVDDSENGRKGSGEGGERWSEAVEERRYVNVAADQTLTKRVGDMTTIASGT